MATRADITPEFIKSILDYDPETGIFIWRKRTPDMFNDGAQTKEHSCARWNARYAGKISSNVSTTGHILLNIYKIKFGAHVVAWAYMTGNWPSLFVDHIDGNPANNSFSNLRLATDSQNKANCKVRKHSKVGLKGVSIYNKSNKFRVAISIRGKRKELGIFDCPAAASFAYQIAADIHFGEFARAF